MPTCKICKFEHKKIGRHILFFHKINMKEYYDKFLKSTNDGVCLNCGTKTNFLNLDKGYNKYCCRECMFLSSTFRQKQKCSHIGKIVSKITRDKISKINKGKVVSKETRNKISQIHKGKIVSEDTKLKISISSKGRVVSKETRNKLSKANIGRTTSEETKRKISIANTGRYVGRKLSEETKRRISIKSKGKKLSEETKRKISIANAGKGHCQTLETRKKISSSSIGKITSEKTKLKKRILKINELKNKYAKYGNKFALRGFEEINCIDNYLQKICPYKIEICFPICGYLVDGYIKEINLVIEFDENHHKKPCQEKKDIERQQNIFKEIGCEFFRIEENIWKSNKNIIVSDFKKYFKFDDIKKSFGIVN